LESVLLSADSEWILNPYVLLFLLFLCSYFLPKGGIKNSHFASLFNTHKYIVFIQHTNKKNKNGSDDSTKNPRRVQRLLRYVLCSLSRSFGFELGLLLLARGGPFFSTQFLRNFFPKANFVIII